MIVVVGLSSVTISEAELAFILNYLGVCIIFGVCGLVWFCSQHHVEIESAHENYAQRDKYSHRHFDLIII